MDVNSLQRGGRLRSWLFAVCAGVGRMEANQPRLGASPKKMEAA